MKEHPIPQDITSYRFHIVGSMTLKQFGEAALGVVLALIVFKTNLPVIFKWPIIMLFVGGGFAAAFLPIEDRPLSHWIATFFSMLYKPTQFFWKREYNLPEPFLYVANQSQQDEVKELDLTPARRQRIKEFLSSTKHGENTGYTTEEEMAVDTVLALFNTQAVPASLRLEVRQMETTEKPNLTVRLRSMRSTTVFENPADAEHIALNSLDNTDAGIYILDPTLTKHQSTDKKNAFLDTSQVAQQLQVPEQDTIEQAVEKPSEEMEVLRQQQSHPIDEGTFNTHQNELTAVSATQSARFNAELPFPTRPTVPNKLVGMILTPQNDLIPEAIVEIKTIQGRVTRAVKTNALGQFFVTTPLPDGEYVLSAEKDGFTFSPLGITLHGKVVEPIEIRSH